MNDGSIPFPALPYQLKGQYGFHQEVSQAAFEAGTHTQNKIGLSSQKIDGQVEAETVGKEKG